jgi:Domain of unknown function (DUF4136)
MRRARQTGTLLVSLITAVAAGCSSVQVESTHDAAVNFTRLRTYAWLRSEDAEAGGKTYGWRIRAAVQKDLDAKGFVAAEGAPDFLVNYLVQTRSTIEARDLPAGYSQTTDWGRTGAGDSYDVERQEGTLVLMMLDPGGRKQIWRAAAKTRLPADLPPEQLTKRVNEIVARMLESFPPK